MQAAISGIDIHYNYNDGDTAYVSNIVNEIKRITIGSAAAVNRTHDAFGNLTNDGANYKYNWDFKDRREKVTNQADTTLATYKYDAMNRRIERTVNGSPNVTTRYIYDGWQVIEERDATGTLLAAYLAPRPPKPKERSQIH